MKQSYSKGIAGFMIALILSLPIYSSFALAVLSNGYMYGETNKVRGYYRKNEKVYYNVTAYINGDNEITPSQIHVCNYNEPIFDSCTSKGSGSFYCIYQTDSLSISKSPCKLKTVLFNDNNEFNSQLVLDGALDENAPEIKSFTVAPTLISSGNLDFQYDVYDHSYSPTDKDDRCSGIKKIELSHNGAIFETLEINSSPNKCSASGTIAVPVNKINASEGTVEVVLTAYDNFNKPSTAKSQFDYDAQAPIIDMDSLEIKDNNGKSINTTGNTPINGVISFIVESDDLNIDNVYGDISQINVDNIPSYKNKKASCVTYEEGYKCAFTNIQVKLSQTTIVPITINAADLAGNIEPAVLTKLITYDNIGPLVKSIKTDRVDSNVNYASSLTTFIVELNENQGGIGIDKNGIKLDLSNIKSGLNNKPADECANSGDDWTCYWRNIIPDANDGEKTISVSGSDKLGNPITGTLSAKVTIDKTFPKVTSIEVKPIGVGVEAIPGYTKTGDSLDITLNIKEKNKLRAYADFSSFVTTQDNVSASCTKEKENEEDWTCELRSSQIDVPGHIISNIYFNLVDIVGNDIQYKKQIEVMHYEDAVNVSYWTSRVKCSPSLVDRQITNLVNARVYCSIELQPITADQETLSINLGSCADNLNNSLGYIESVNLINAERGSTEPYLSIDLIKGEMTIDKLSFTCPLQIISRVGDKINKNPEIEQIKININFYNMPLGEYGRGIEDKIKDAKDEAFGSIWKIVGTLKEILKYAKLICNVLYTLHKIWFVLQALTEGVTTAHIAMVGTPVAPMLGAAASGACYNDKTMEKLTKRSYSTEMGDKFCKFINCQMSPKAPGDDKGGDAKKGSWFGNIKDSLGSWTYQWTSQGNELLAQAPGGGAMAKVLSFGKVGGGEGTIGEYFGKQPYQYMNARDNLLVALLLGCIPGIINGLDKYRQIQCLYADCLEQNAYNNVPVKVCEDQKSYATCKYIFGEIFAVLPWTALFDYYTGMIRSALSDPLTAIATGINILRNVCEPTCDSSAKASATWLHNQQICRGLQFFALLGEIINDVQGIIDDYKQIKGDYCKRLND